DRAVPFGNAGLDGVDEVLVLEAVRALLVQRDRKERVPVDTARCSEQLHLSIRSRVPGEGEPRSDVRVRDPESLRLAPLDAQAGVIDQAANGRVAGEWEELVRVEPVEVRGRADAHVAR